MHYYSFFFHYNKPASLKAQRPQLSIHYRGACHIVDKIKCLCSIESKNRTVQPRCVMSGKCKDFIIENVNGEIFGILK